MISSQFKLFFFIVTALLLVSASYSIEAQNTIWNSGNNVKKKTSEKAKQTKSRVKKLKKHLETWGLDTSYNNTFLIGGKLNTDGWSGSLYFLKKRSYNSSNVLQLNFSELKHEKQTKQKSATNNYKQFGNASQYVYGKINNLYTLQVGFGKEHLLLPAVLDDNLSVSLRYTIGFSLGMLKPYYLKLIYLENRGGIDTVHLEQHKYSSSDSSKFLEPTSIFGASKWSKSLNEIKYIPGAYLETSVVIMPGKNKFFIQAITLGVNASFYSSKLPIMADQPAYPWVASLFAGFAIGERWK